LTRQQDRLLTEVLQIASRLYSKGNTKGAISALRTFNLLVNILINISNLSDKNGHALIEAAQKIIDDIQASKPLQMVRGKTGDNIQDDNKGQSFQNTGKYITLGNYPNPFSQATVISFELIKEARVQLSIYDNNGRMITRLLNQAMPAGTHTITWEARHLAAGIYSIQLSAGKVVKTHQMVHVK
jgi:hypothetical protein